MVREQPGDGLRDGLVNIVVRARVYNRIARIVRGGLLIMEGIIQRQDSVIDILARRAPSLAVLDTTTELPMAPAAQALRSQDFR